MLSDLQTFTYELTKRHPDYPVAIKQLNDAKEIANQLIFMTRQKYFYESGKNNKFSEVESLGYTASEFKYSRFFLSEVSRDLRNTGADITLPAKCTQEVARRVSEMWKSNFALIKAFKNGKISKWPGIPKYIEYTYPVNFTYQAMKIKELNDGVYLVPSQWTRGFKVPYFVSEIQAAELIKVSNNKLLLSVQYRSNKDYIDGFKGGENVAAIDYGLENLYTIGFSDFSESVIIDGKPLKAINSRYNFNRAKLQSSHGKKAIPRSNKMNILGFNRKKRLKHYYQTVNNRVIDLLKSREVGTLVLGYNKEMKQKSKLSKRVNRNFVPIPFKRILDDLAYKAERAGLSVIWTEESYTSKASFKSCDPMKKEGTESIYQTGRRIHRGLYRNMDNSLIHADLNAALNILRKVEPGFHYDESYGDWSVVTRIRRLDTTLSREGFLTTCLVER